VLEAEEDAARARTAAMQQAAKAMDAPLPNEDPYTGNRIGENWFQSQSRVHGRYIGRETEK
jgi:hypothetical protein